MSCSDVAIVNLRYKAHVNEGTVASHLEVRASNRRTGHTQFTKALSNNSVVNNDIIMPMLTCSCVSCDA